MVVLIDSCKRPPSLLGHLNCDSYLRNKSGLIFLWPFCDFVYLALDGKRTADTIDIDNSFPLSATVLKSKTQAPDGLRT